jgi:hypothetical protein
VGRVSAFATPFREKCGAFKENNDDRGAYFKQNLLVFTFRHDHFRMRSCALCLAHWPLFFHSSFPFPFLLLRRRFSEVAALSLQREHILEAAVQVFGSSSECMNVHSRY